MKRRSPQWLDIRGTQCSVNNAWVKSQLMTKVCLARELSVK